MNDRGRRHSAPRTNTNDRPEGYTAIRVCLAMALLKPCILCGSPPTHARVCGACFERPNRDHAVEVRIGVPR